MLNIPAASRNQISAPLSSHLKRVLMKNLVERCKALLEQGEDIIQKKVYLLYVSIFRYIRKKH